MLDACLFFTLHHLAVSFCNLGISTLFPISTSDNLIPFDFIIIPAYKLSSIMYYTLV